MCNGIHKYEGEVFFNENKLFKKFQSHEFMKHNVYDIWKSIFHKVHFVICIIGMY